MSEAVKRYMQHAPLTEAVPAVVRLYPGATQYVLAADHDRIVAELTERCRELESVKNGAVVLANSRYEWAVEEQRNADTLRAEVEQARGTAEYWKAGLLNANAEVERLQGLLKEARYPVAHYLSDREEASDRAPTKSMRYEAGQSVLKVRRLLINIDAALEASRCS